MATVKELMEKLDCTEEEALQIIADDEEIEHGADLFELTPEQKKASKVFKKRPHTVKAGESMYSIAQMYGIRLKSLYKMNHMGPDDSIVAGQQLKVR